MPLADPVFPILAPALMDHIGDNLTLVGDVTGAATATSVGKIRGKNIPTPVAGDDQKTWIYDHASGAMLWVTRAHTHPQSEITNLVADLAAKASNTDLATKAPNLATISAVRDTDFTLAVGDVNTLNRVGVTTARTISFPTDSVAIPIGASGEIVRTGTATITLARLSTALIRSSVEWAGTTNRTIAVQGGLVSWMKIASNEFLLSGALT
jgi:hypothetical protein